MTEVLSRLSSAAFPAALAAVFILSLACYSLRNFSRSRLEEICRRRGRPERLGDILHRHHRCLLLCELLWLVTLTTAVVICIDGDVAPTTPVGGSVGSAGLHVPHVGGTFRIAATLISAAFALVALPWTLSRVAGEAFLYHTWPALRAACLIGAPVWNSAVRLDRIIHRVFGVPEPAPETAASLLTEELLAVVDESRREGVIESHASTMIRRVMDLQDEDVAAIMTPRTDMVTIPATVSISDALGKMLENGFSRVPVIGENIDDIVGILYARDLLAVAAGHGTQGDHVTVRDIARDVLYVPESQGIGDLLESMRQKKVHMAIIVDEYSGVSGLVTLEDILEEIVGDISDEYDSEETALWKKHSSGITEVDARYHLDDLNEEFGYEFPEDEEFDTIGGFALSCFGRIPQTGETHLWKELKLTVLEADERRLIRLRIEGTATVTRPAQR
ncbi:MAG: HlyC/CorC family transporter [Planctomycetaceae bacterium]|nr:HlyC/CorC family transporter [Planctomycetaceae bacterium]